MASGIRSLVSKKKKRYQENGFDLDLTYIDVPGRPDMQKRIIAMGFPSEGNESLYRNPMPEVKRFFQTLHPGNKVRIYNLCSERAYAPDKFEAEHIASCRRFGFDDHNPAPIPVIRSCVEDMHDWTAADPEHVVALHCKAGKGRTGLIVSAYLVREGLARDTMEALRVFDFDLRLNVYDKEKEKYVMKKVFDYYKTVKKVRNAKAKDKFADIDVQPLNVICRGDCKLVLYDYDNVGSHDKMCWMWFNTGFISNNYLRFHKSVIDKACKDTKNKHFSPDFQVELFFEELTGEEAEFEIEGEIVVDDRDDGAELGDDDAAGEAGGMAAVAEEDEEA